jgi:hypothetical protein
MIQKPVAKAYATAKAQLAIDHSAAAAWRFPLVARTFRLGGGVAACGHPEGRASEKDKP